MTLDQKLLLVWEYEGGGSGLTDPDSIVAFQSRRRAAEVTPGCAEVLKRAPEHTYAHAGSVRLMSTG